MSAVAGGRSGGRSARGEAARLLGWRVAWLALAVLIAVQATSLAVTFANTDPDRLASGSPDHFLNTFDSGLAALVAFLYACLAIYGFVLGAWYLGARLGSGGTVRLGRALGALTGALLTVCVLAATVYIGELWILAQVTGAPGPGGHWADLVWLSVRGTVLAAASLLLGAGLAVLTGRAAVAMLLALGYVLAWELGGRELLRAIGAEQGRPFMLAHAGAWLTAEPDRWPAGGLILAALVAVTTFVAAARHRYRESSPSI